MYGKVLSGCVTGIEGQLIEVEVDLSNGLPQFNIVGLPDSAVRESMDRVRASIKNCKFSFPMERITVNLAPANLRKQGSAFDLAIAVGILVTSKQIVFKQLEQTLLIGELALDGSLRPIPGVLSMVHSAKKKGLTKVLLPIENAQEAMLVEGIEICPLSHIKELSAFSSTAKSVNRINDLVRSEHFPGANGAASSIAALEDFMDVKGQYQAKRALMIAAAGMHNILFIGPPGSGKTMLIRRLPSILPPLSDTEALEVTKIYSVAEKLSDRTRLIRKRPFRSPHHTISEVGLIGGGTIPKPGEVSLAHRGILFLDEMPEFSRNTLEVMRQPLEDRHVTIARATAVISFPTQFILAASMNPCPCGYLGSETKTHTCICSLPKIQRYRSKISGPLLDRIDLHVEVPRVEYSELAWDPHQSSPKSLSSSQMQQAVMAAQLIQEKRYREFSILFNGELSGTMLREYCQLDSQTEQLLHRSFDALGLSVRAHDRILKIARTIADLEGAVHIEFTHLAEAIQYRNLDRKYMSD